MPASAAILTVTNLNDSGPGSLRDTIAAAAAGDTIQFGVSGTINTEATLVIRKNLTISNADPVQLIIQRNPAPATPEFRVMEVGTLNGQSITVNISGVTLRNGRGNGGGCFSHGANLTMSNCRITGNSSDDTGGGLYNLASNEYSPALESTLTLNSCVLDGNSALNNGSAIANVSVSIDSTATARLNLDSCYLSGGVTSNREERGVGRPPFGGTIYNRGAGYLYSQNGFNWQTAAAVIQRTRVTGNWVRDSGGAVINLGGRMEFTDCLLDDNRASLGGAVSSHHGSLLLTRCSFSENVAQDSAGADLELDDRGFCELLNSTLASNSSKIDRVTFTASYCFFRKVYLGQLTVASMNNCLIDGDLFGSASSAGQPTDFTSNGYNLCRGTGDGLLTGTGDRINTDPRLDPRGLRDNGGLTPTILLLGDSPAIDAGKRFGSGTYDQRQLSRTVDHAGVQNALGGDGTDIGPVEMADLIQSGILTVTTTDDHDDGVAGVADCTLREAIASANTFPGQVINFAPGLSGTITLVPALGPLRLNADMAITGPGARMMAVSGGDAMRVLEVSAGKECIVSGLTLRNGRGPFGDARGAGLSNAGRLTVLDCAFTAHQVLGLPGSQPGAAGATASGGAIYNTGTLRLERCSFSGNTARGGNGAAHSGFGRGGDGGGGLGAAIFSEAAASLTAANCTFYANTGQGGTGGSNSSFAGGNGGTGRGGVYSAGPLSVTSCTFSSNVSTGGAGGDGNNQFNDGTAGSSGGALAATAAGATVGNTISAGNTGGNSPDVVGVFQSRGFNLIGVAPAGSGFTAAGDRTGTSASPFPAGLGAYQNNGGQTNTLLPGTGSAALDGGRAFDSPLDQRRQLRRYDDPARSNAPGSDGTDIGAVETQPPVSQAFRILSVEKQGRFLSIIAQASASTSYRYQLQHSPRLDSGFVNEGQELGIDSSGMVQFMVSPGTGSRGFYRVVRRLVL